jgi:hypothetical protein
MPIMIHLAGVNLKIEALTPPRLRWRANHLRGDA